jgi:hypothetical protein
MIQRRGLLKIGLVSPFVIGNSSNLMKISSGIETVNEWITYNKFSGIYTLDKFHPNFDFGLISSLCTRIS